MAYFHFFGSIDFPFSAASTQRKASKFLFRFRRTRIKGTDRLKSNYNGHGIQNHYPRVADENFKLRFLFEDTVDFFWFNRMALSARSASNDLVWVHYSSGDNSGTDTFLRRLWRPLCGVSSSRPWTTPCVLRGGGLWLNQRTEKAILDNRRTINKALQTKSLIPSVFF